MAQNKKCYLKITTTISEIPDILIIFSTSYIQLGIYKTLTPFCIWAYCCSDKTARQGTLATCHRGDWRKLKVVTNL